MVFIQMTEYEPYIHSGIHQFNISFDRVWWDVDGETRQTFLPQLLPGKNGTSVSIYRWLLLPSVFFFSSFLRYTHTQANVSRVSSHLNKKKWFSYALVFLSMLSEKVKEVIKLKKVDFWVTAFVYTANYKLSRSQHADNITPDNIPIRITKQIAV